MQLSADKNELDTAKVVLDEKYKLALSEIQELKDMLRKTEYQLEVFTSEAH